MIYLRRVAYIKCRTNNEGCVVLVCDAVFLAEEHVSVVSDGTKKQFVSHCRRRKKKTYSVNVATVANAISCIWGEIILPFDCH